VKSKVGEHSVILVQSAAFSYIESSRTYTIMKPQRNLLCHVPCNLFILNFVLSYNCMRCITRKWRRLHHYLWKYTNNNLHHSMRSHSVLPVITKYTPVSEKLSCLCWPQLAPSCI